MYDFIFKPFNEMTEEDYKTVGFKSGLEIHQQLLTEKKLFCRCPAGKYTREFDAEILRHMRPTLSEMGVYDGTALMEFKTKKNISYTTAMLLMKSILLVNNIWMEVFQQDFNVQLFMRLMDGFLTKTEK